MLVVWSVVSWREEKSAGLSAVKGRLLSKTRGGCRDYPNGRLLSWLGQGGLITGCAYKDKTQTYWKRNTSKLPIDDWFCFYLHILVVMMFAVIKMNSLHGLVEKYIGKNHLGEKEAITMSRKNIATAIFSIFVFLLLKQQNQDCSYACRFNDRYENGLRATPIRHRCYLYLGCVSGVENKTQTQIRMRMCACLCLSGTQPWIEAVLGILAAVLNEVRRFCFSLCWILNRRWSQQYRLAAYQYGAICSFDSAYVQR